MSLRLREERERGRVYVLSKDPRDGRAGWHGKDGTEASPASLVDGTSVERVRGNAVAHASESEGDVGRGRAREGVVARLSTEGRLGTPGNLGVDGVGSGRRDSNQ